MAAYELPAENEWVQPVRRGYKLCCCDCGLVHDLDFRIYNGKIQMRARRNNRSTGQVRRHNNIEVAHPGISPREQAS